MGLLDGEIASIINDATDFIMLDATIAPMVKTATTPGRVTESHPISHDVRGFIEDYSDFARSQSGIPATDRQITILANSFKDSAGNLLTPAKGDLVTIESKTYRIEDVKRDPARATWEIRGR